MHIATTQSLAIRYCSEVTSHSLATLLLDSRRSTLYRYSHKFYENQGQRRALDWLARNSFARLSTLFSLQVLAKILRESRPMSCTRLAELDHSRVCQLCHLSDEFKYFTAAGLFTRASLVWLDLCERISLDYSSFSYEFRVNYS